MEAIGTLYLRGKKWRWKVKVPADLTHLHKYLNDEGKPKQNAADVNLKTEDQKEAQAKATIQAAQWAAVFDADRKGLAVALQPPTPITPELMEAISQAAYRIGLEQDDALRETKEGMAALDAVHAEGAARSLARLGIRGKTQRKAEASSIENGLSDGATAAASSLTALADGAAAVGLARKRIATVKPLAGEAVKRLGLRVDWDTPEGQQTLRRCLEAHRKAWQDRSRRDAGEVVTTPISTSGFLESKPRGHKLREAFERWEKVSSELSEATVKNKRLALELFEEFTGNIDVEGLDPERGDDFAAWLRGRAKAPKTAKDRLDAVKSLISQAKRLRWITSNPWEDISIKVPKAKVRKPWPSEALVKLFDSPLFREYALPESSRAGGAAAYWVPLLAIYTGARESELCQLRVKDVDREDSHLFVSITREPADEEEGTLETVTKTASSQRRIPVHSALLALGFEDYLKSMRDSGAASLFPDVKRKEGVPAGEQFGRWFNDVYREQQGVKKRWQDFHAFRHTAKTKLMGAFVSRAMSNFITGHVEGGRGSAGDYEHPETVMHAVIEAVERMQYPELDLKRVYWPKK